MPKETTHYGKMYKQVPSKKDPEDGLPLTESTQLPYYPGEPLEDGEVVTGGPSFSVNWSKEQGHVQVSILFPREQWLACAKTIEGDPTLSDMAIYTDTWTRQEINNTIRILRRARDQAFGADE